MCKTFQCLPDDPKITEIPYLTKAWMFNHWLEDKSDEFEVSKHNGYMIGSFIDPEAVDKMINNKGQHKSTDEEFEESFQMVKNNDLGVFKNILEEISEPKESPIKRKRKILTGNE